MKYHVWSFYGTGWDKTDFDELADAEVFAGRNIGTTYIYPAVVPQCKNCKRWERLHYGHPNAPIDGDCHFLDAVTADDFGCLQFEPKD